MSRIDLDIPAQKAQTFGKHLSNASYCTTQGSRPTVSIQVEVPAAWAYLFTY